jgi:hypothetical protein
VFTNIARLDASNLLILQYPMWWHLPPANLKGWYDRVFIYGEVYASKKRFEAGRFKGKRAILSVTVGTGPETYAYSGRSGDIDLMLWPVNFTLAYVGYTVLTPFIAYGVEAGIRYSDPGVVEKRQPYGSTNVDYYSGGHFTKMSPPHSCIRRLHSLQSSEFPRLRSPQSASMKSGRADGQARLTR